MLYIQWEMCEKLNERMNECVWLRYTMFQQMATIATTDGNVVIKWEMCEKLNDRMNERIIPHLISTSDQLTAE